MNLPENLNKLYYSIGEVSEMFGVTNSLIRYWESEFKSLKPQKSKRGDRRYTKADIQELALVYELVKERGFTIEGAKKELANIKNSAKSGGEDKVVSRLSAIKKKMLQLKNRIQSL
jgi:DNA-binding transcriptional MerR regulator